MPGIVVGVDGSPNSELALAWAMNEAAIRQLPLTVMVVHQAVVSWATGHPVSYPGEAPETERAEEAVEAMVEKATDKMGASRPGSVTIRAVNGFPAEQLIETSRDADMIVVGSRGREGFSRLLLGSVSTQVVHHASCPVVVVPHPERHA